MEGNTDFTISGTKLVALVGLYFSNKQSPIFPTYVLKSGKHNAYNTSVLRVGMKNKYEQGIQGSHRHSTQSTSMFGNGSERVNITV